MDSKSGITPHEDPHDGFWVKIDPDNQDPIPAEIVSDRRNTIGKRLSVVGVVGLILFFLISAYIQAVKNGHRPQSKPPVVTVTVRPGPSVISSPVVTPVPVPTIVVVTSPGPVETSGPAPRPSNTGRAVPGHRKSPKPSPHPHASPSPTCLLPSPVPCI